MNVTLLTKTPEFSRVIWAAGRTCHSGCTPEELFAHPDDESKRLKLIDFLMKSRHLSTLEHCSATFAVSDVSRTLLAQYSRHRIGVSLSVQSQRYVSARSERVGHFPLVLPKGLKNEEAKARFEQAMDDAQKAYDDLVALGVPMEDARFVLPGAASTNFVTTVNLRSMIDLYEKRVLVKGAQWEVRELIQRMAELLVEAEPWLAPYFPKPQD